MPTLHSNVEIEIASSPETVWSVVSDYDTDKAWRRGIREMTPDTVGAPRVGTNVREVLQLGGKEYVTETTVTEVGPGLSYRFSGAGTSGRVSGRRSVRDGDRPGTAVFAYDVELQPEGIPRFAQPLMAGWLRHSLRRDLRRLRTMLEAH